jgi:hypothetical protein
MLKARTNRLEMAAWVRRWEGSGLSAAGFCRRHRIPAQRLSYWRRMAGGSRLEKKGRGDEGSAFVPVQVVDLGAGNGSLEVVLVGGDRLVLQEGVSVDLLRSTVAVLRERC